MSLTFDQMRSANVTRCHEVWGGHEDWTAADWLTAVVGELGEYANEAKKFKRGDYTPEQFNALARKELADVQTYLDLLAHHLGIDLGRATMQKFNEVSERVGSDIFFDAEGGGDWFRTSPPGASSDG